MVESGLYTVRVVLSRVPPSEGSKAQRSGYSGQELQRETLR